ncbi:D-alanyl-D-alanine carboxypeptidase/D-alanyl-D-alanine-endopeptidase [Bacteroidales bacterium OttesenSCG-928-I21]|nr:D-alanyl-D-alanine carboxypeptidase/D-alanyl-D-alanine-endopeptidase [Bacteroidales bacterium OttesenSCG-928-I21]
MNKFLLILFITYLPTISLCQTKNYSQILIDFTNKKELKNAGISLYAENTKSGKIILDHNSNTSLIPASILKIFSTSIALELFGANHKFKTELAYDGTINSGVLNGNLYIIGNGDPCLGSSNFSSHYNQNSSLLDIWTEQIKKLGITKITGNIVADISYFGEIPIPDTWLWEDIANYYGHQGSALNYLDNMYHLHFSTGTTENSKTKITKIAPEDIGIIFENQVLSSSLGSDNSCIYYTSDKTKRVIKGTLPWKRNNFVIKGSMPEPELFLVKNFAKKLKTNGIEIFGEQILVSKSENNEKQVFYKTYSPTLQEITNITNTKSNNLYAEVLGQHISKKTGKSYKNAVIDFLQQKKINTDGLNIVDACGLSPFNSLTAKQMTKYLKYLSNTSTQANNFLKTLPVSGKNGTLLSNHKNPDWNIYAKSGSMTRVRAYAGYIIYESGEKIAFCFVVNNYNCSGFQMKQIFEELFNNLGANL